MSDIDNSISQNFMQVFGSTLSLIAGFGLVLSMLPAFIIWLIPLFYGYYRTQKMYRQTAREMKRLNSTARSPIFQHFDETISGLITIRALGGVDRFALKNQYNVDYHMRAEMGLNVAQRWLTFRLSSLAALTLFITTFVITLFPDMMDAGLVGLAMNYSMMATGNLQGAIDAFSQLELQMNSIERVKEYSEMKVEAAYDQQMEDEEGGNKRLTVPARSWPGSGRCEGNHRDDATLSDLPACHLCGCAGSSSRTSPPATGPSCPRCSRTSPSRCSRTRRSGSLAGALQLQSLWIIPTAVVS